MRPGATIGRPVLFARRPGGELDFHEATLEDLARHLRGLGIPTVLDERAISNAGRGRDDRFSFELSGVQLRAALTLLMEQLQLTWTIRDQVLRITTSGECDSSFGTRVYDVSAVVSQVIWLKPTGSRRESYDFGTLIDLITTTIAPDTWDSVGGIGTIEPLELRGTPLLAISQTDDVMRQVDGLLRNICSLVGDQPRSPGESQWPGSNGLPRSRLRRTGQLHSEAETVTGSWHGSTDNAGWIRDYQ